MKKIEEVIIEGWATRLIEDCGALAVTMYFLRLHLQAMNTRLEVSHCCAMYLWMSMIIFTSLTGVNITPKRNMVSETISNMFIVMHLGVCNPCYCTGNFWRSQHEFTCSDFASHVEKENCKLCLRGDCLLLTLSLRAIKHNFLIIFNMA
jgi:hypothetical protein